MMRRSLAGLLPVAAMLAAPAAAPAAINEAYRPQDEFKLDPWFSIGPIEFNKAVLYIIIATTLTCLAMVYVARRMQARPNRLQTAVEAAFLLMRDNITRGNMDDRMAAKWFPFIATLFLFIWFSNIIGYLPLPTNTEHTVNIFGLEIPSLALYAATANLSVPLVLTLDTHVVVPHGSYDHLLQTRNFSGIEPNVTEEKFYARGVGVVLEITV